MACPITQYVYIDENKNQVIIWYIQNTSTILATLIPTTPPNGWQQSYTQLNTGINNIPYTQNQLLIIDYTGKKVTDAPSVYWSSNQTFGFYSPTSQTLVDFTSTGLPPQFSGLCCGNIKNQGSCPSNLYQFQGDGFLGTVQIWHFLNADKYIASYIYATPPPNFQKSFTVLDPSQKNIIVTDPTSNSNLTISFNASNPPPQSISVDWNKLSVDPFPAPQITPIPDFGESGIPVIYGGLCCSSNTTIGRTIDKALGMLGVKCGSIRTAEYIIGALVIILLIVIGIVWYRRRKMMS